jgi:symplekin
MNEIKNKLSGNPLESDLAILFFYYHQMNPMEVMYFWNNIIKLLNEDTVVLVLGFVLDLQDSSIVFPRYAQKSLNFHIHQINKKIAKLLPRHFSFYLKNLKLFKFAKEPKTVEIKEKKFDSQAYFLNYLYDLLVRTPTVEITNAIENYYNLGVVQNIEIDLTKKLLNSIQKIDTQYKNKYIKYISSILSNPGDIVEYIYYTCSEQDSVLILEYIYLYSKQLYTDILNVIYENRKYYRLEIIQTLLDLEIEKFNFRDDNLEIIKYLLINKPIYLNEIYEVLNTKISKRNLVEIYIENYDILKDFKFNFNFDELITISSKKPQVIYNLYELIQTDDQRQTVYNLFKTLDEGLIVEFLEKNNDLELISYILTNRQLKYNLKDYIVERYKNNTIFVYKLFIYLDKSEVQSHIEDLLVDKKSLEYFLLVLKPTDILVHAHEISDISKGMRIIDLCMTSPGFNENDFIFTLNIVADSMPQLIIRTLILTLKKYPHLKNFTVSYLFKMINKNALSIPKFKIGIIKCMEMIGPAAVDIIANLPEERMINILKNSIILRDMSSETVYKKENRFKKDLNVLRNVIRNNF